jgi:hypothetical protein
MWAWVADQLDRMSDTVFAAVIIALSVASTAGVAFALLR